MGIPAKVVRPALSLVLLLPQPQCPLLIFPRSCPLLCPILNHPSPRLSTSSHSPSPGRSLRLLLLRGNLHLPHPLPAPHEKHRLHPRRIWHRNRTRLRRHPLHMRHRHHLPTRSHPFGLHLPRLRHRAQPLRRRRPLRPRLPPLLPKVHARIPLPPRRRAFPDHERGYHVTFCRGTFPWGWGVCESAGEYDWEAADEFGKAEPGDDGCY